MVKQVIVKVLKEEGYIEGFLVVGDKKFVLIVDFWYFEGSLVIEKIFCVSCFGLCVYKNVGQIFKVKGGFGVMIVFINQGIFFDCVVCQVNVGGELICEVF